MTKMSFYIELTKSIKWTDHPRRIKIYQVHKVDRSSKKDEEFIKPIKWTVHPRRMITLPSP